MMATFQRCAISAAAAVMCAIAVTNPVRAAEPNIERVQVTDPYLEFRTGPGRGYPIHYVAAREEWVQIVMRHTDWYKVIAANGREGWVHRRQLQTTLTEFGGTKAFRDIVVDDYLARKVEFGAGWGRFKKEPMLKLWTGYKLHESIGVEASVGQVQGLFSGTDFWHVNLQMEPWSDRRLSPFAAIGFGRFKNIPNESLVGAQTTNANLAGGQIGLRYYLTERFVLRADYSIYTAYVAETRSIEYRATTIGLSFFF
jgi:hypothetical protein